MQKDSIKTCEYDDCNLPVNKPHDTKFCIFHAPKDNKGITRVEFNEIIRDKIYKNDFNFRNYVFPGKIIFPILMSKALVNADFNGAIFSGDADFSETRFSGLIDFNGAKFLENAYFSGAQFSKLASFYNTQFSGCTDFGKVHFLGEAFFVNAQFSGNANFKESQFSGPIAFSGANFSGDADFKEAQFSKTVYFIENIVQKKMSFENISLLKDSYFYFRNPNFNPSGEREIFIDFKGIKFLPFRTYFENIDPKEGLSKQGESGLHICFLFRYCQLEDVYFTKSDMSFFSFYKSNFDQARFVSCDWRKEPDTVCKVPYERRNILFEDFLLSSIPKNEKDESEFRKKYQIEDIQYREISSLYRRMKTALDRTKDYQESGWFYFNEFETKRRELKFGPRKFIYYLYKVFSGYGEKPSWSFIWLLIFAVIFSFGHLFSGLNTSRGLINYDISFTWESIRNIFSTKEFIMDWLNSIIFTFYRLIPVNYMPVTESTITPVGLDGLVLSLLNTLILILMITFIGIGLKRQFRRF